MLNLLQKKSGPYLIRLACLIVLFGGCKLLAPGISNYDAYSYQQTTSLKVDAMNLMDEATEDYALHSKDIKLLQSNLAKIYEYEKHRPKNEITTKQWEILSDTSGHLLGGFIVKWRKEGKQGRVYIDEKKKQIATAFDQIAELESKKIKPAEIKN